MRNPISTRRAVPFRLVPLLAALALVILLMSVVSARDVPLDS